ncbi:hypothetical protein ACFSHT_38500 [Paraburkholderia silviterrae]|uniref:Secreted protein n=1 Tax=Paraburkholderia silviterrae TaxID=2528715 RepID=A0A4R5LZ99_9BURK|nr:hypothetical protein [Paraburkholderia silviterrae]TDG17854.1 hypothetical protein EYW47_36360 [Paraburkholderia silviterrae]
MSRSISPRFVKALCLAIWLALFASNKIAEPAPASMVVSLVVQQSCLVMEADAVDAPAVSCLHGEPYLVSRGDAPVARFGSEVQYAAYRAASALWIVMF